MTGPNKFMNRKVVRIVLTALLLSAATSTLAQPNDNASDPLQTDQLEGYAILIGKWHPNPASLSKGFKQWRKDNDISDNWIEFAWGSDHQWMLFGDWQRKAGKDRHTGAGLIAYDPAGLRIAFTEHGIRGAMVSGSLERVSPTEIIRDIVVSRTDRSWRQIDRWVWSSDNKDCFDWMTTFINAEGRNESESNRWCRMPEGKT